jgi:hypothetical protein
LQQQQQTEDSVNQEKFKLLNESTELKQILSNVHLRNLLKTINESGEKSVDIQMERAMQEPLFTEFADVCLKLVQDQNELIMPVVGVVNKKVIDFKLEDLME